MKILAIETTDRAGSVALLEGRQVAAESRLDERQRSAQSLAPAIRALLQSAGWQPAEIRLVAVAIGPGSFTGLRVGVTTAKTFAYAIGCDLVGVPTLEVVAAQVPAELHAAAAGRTISAVLDAGRQQVFSARFRHVAGSRIECIEPAALLDDAVWLAGIQAESRVGEIISGPGLRKFSTRLPASSNLAPAECWGPRAATVGLLALARHEAGQRDKPWRLVPDYHRASAAEEKLAQSPPP